MRPKLTHSSAREKLLGQAQERMLAKAKQDMKVLEQNLLHFKRYLQSLFGE